MSLSTTASVLAPCITGLLEQVPLGVLSPELASRAQFGWAITIHIIFATISIGLAPFLVYFVIKEVRTGEDRYVRLRKFWTKLFALGFIMGTVTGIPMSFLFGMNFASFSEIAGELIGGPLTFEAQMAFFLEAVFLGVLLFGRDRVSDLVYVFSSVMVAVGAWLSAFWILVVNAWMQTPRGYEMIGSDPPIAELTDPFAAFFTPRLPWMYIHMQLAAVLSMAVLIAGIAAYFVWKHDDSEVWTKALKVAIAVLLVTSMAQAVQGDLYAGHVEETQPQKFAAMEAHYETGSADLHIIAVPTELESFTDPRADNLYTVSIPHLASFLASGGDPSAEITGLNDFEYESPPVAWVFWSFRIMVGLGLWFIFLGLWGSYRLLRGGITKDERYLKALMLSSPLGFVAVITGWYVAEIGRQPWVIQGELTTADGVSPALGSTEATATLLVFIVGYILLMGVFIYIFKRLINRESEHYESAVEERDSPDTPEVTADD